MVDSDASATGKSAPTPHTPEPWTWGMLYVTKPDPTNPRRDDAGYLRIAMHPSGETQPERGEWEANARRIVACVNACAGIPTSHLEAASRNLAIQQIIDERDEAKQMLIGEHDAHMQCHAERDALEAVLRKVAKLYSDDPGTSDLYDEQPVPMTLGLLRQVWAVLSRVKRKGKWKSSGAGHGASAYGRFYLLHLL